MTGDIEWLITSGLALVTVIGGLIARDRSLVRLITSGDDRLHERINKVRDEYVRRDDLDKDINNLEKGLDQLRSDMHDHAKSTNERLDKLITLTSLRVNKDAIP